MIERYTIKFGPAVSQKELEKALYEDGDLSKAHHLKARIELVGEAEDIKKLADLMKTLSCAPVFAPVSNRSVS
jgi:hypothetical protein